MKKIKVFSLLFAITLALTLTLPAFPRDTGPVPKTEIISKEKISDQSAPADLTNVTHQYTRDAGYTRLATHYGFSSVSGGIAYARHTAVKMQLQGCTNFYVAHRFSTSPPLPDQSLKSVESTAVRRLRQ